MSLHRPVQFITPRITHSHSRRKSARSTAVWNQPGLASMVTCMIRTAAAMSSTPGMEFRVV